jgi:hypothetical protein
MINSKQLKSSTTTISLLTQQIFIHSFTKFSPEPCDQQWKLRLPTTSLLFCALQVPTSNPSPVHTVYHLHCAR